MFLVRIFKKNVKTWLKLFWKSSQYLQERNRQEPLFLKGYRSTDCYLIKKDSCTVVFLLILGNFPEQFFFQNTFRRLVLTRVCTVHKKFQHSQLFSC